MAYQVIGRGLPLYMISQLIVNGLAIGCSYATLGAGINFFLLGARFLNVGYGSCFLVSGYVFYFLAVRLNANSVLGVVAALVGAGSVAAIQEIGVFSPLRRSGSSAGILLLASFGLLIVVQNLIALSFGDAIKIAGGRELTTPWLLGEVRILPIQLVVIFSSIALIWLSWFIIQNTSFGRQVRAYSENPLLAQIIGVGELRIVISSSLLGAAIATVSAVLHLYDNGLQPGLGFNAVLLGLVAAIIGGVGSFPGVFLAGLLIGIFQQLLLLVLPSQWQDVMTYILLAAFLLLRPQGFLGVISRKVGG